MTSRTIINLVLFALLIGLLLVSLYPALFHDEQQPDTQNNLTSLAAKDIHSIVITNQHGTTRLALQNGTWQMLEPVVFKANQYTSNNIAQIAQLISRAHYPINPDKLQEYGLGKPRLTLMLNDFNIRFGATDPIQQSRYVATDNNIYLVNDQFSHLLEQAPNSLFDTSVLMGRTDISELHLPSFKLIKQSGNWQLSQATVQGLSQDDLVRYVDEWRYAQALKVKLFASPEKKIDIRSPHVEIRFSNQEPILLYVDISDGNPALINPAMGIQYQVTKDKLNQLLALPTPPITK